MDLDKLKELGYSIVDTKLNEIHSDNKHSAAIADGLFSTVVDICAQMIIAYEDSKGE